MTHPIPDVIAAAIATSSPLTASMMRKTEHTTKTTVAEVRAIEINEPTRFHTNYVSPLW